MFEAPFWLEQLPGGCLLFSVFFGLSQLLEQMRQQRVVRPDTGVQFQKHACIRILLVVFSPGRCFLDSTLFHMEWCAYRRMTFRILCSNGLPVRPTMTISASKTSLARYNTLADWHSRLRYARHQASAHR